MDYLSKYNPLKQVPYKVRYDGNEWKYMGHIVGAKKNPGMGIQKSLNEGSEGSCSHYVYNFAGFANRSMMYDIQINVCEKVFFNRELSEKDKELAAGLIKDKILKHESDDKIIVDIPFFKLEQKKEFDVLIDKYFDGIVSKIADVVKRYTDGYIKLFPKHLKSDAEQAMCFFFVGGFYANLIMVAQENNLLDNPSPDSFCDVIIQFK